MLISVLLFASLGFVYALAVPMFEAPDEPAHFAYANFLKEYKRLPVKSDFPPYLDETHYPPLYYSFVALALGLIHSEPIRLHIKINPRGPLSGGEDKRLLDPSQEVVRPPEALRALHLLRIIQLVFGLAVVYLTYKLAVTVAPSEPEVAWLATGFCATLPQFTFISAIINNDNLANASSSLALYWVVRLSCRGEPGLSLRDSLIFALIAALGLLSKFSLVFVLPLFVVYIMTCALTMKIKLRHIAVMLVAALALAGWFYLRNFALYGRLGHATGYPFLVRMSNEPITEQILAFVKDFTSALLPSFWGFFGWFNVPIGRKFLYLYYGLLLVGFAGLLLRWFRPFGLTTGQPPLRSEGCLGSGVGLLILAVSLVFAQVVGYNLFIEWSPQGRYMFPALSAISVLWACGLSRLYRHLSLQGAFQRLYFTRLAQMLLLFLAFLNLLCVWLYLVPAYRY